MKAAVLTSFGGPDAFTITDLPQPELSGGHVRVTVEAASLGPWDAQAANGNFTGLGGLATFPQQIGWDFAGTIQATSPDVEGFAVGDRVFGFIPQPWMGTGTAAETITLPAGLLSVTPEGLGPVIAATLPVALLTADIALTTARAVQGSRLLILGAAGGVGSFVTQLAARQSVVVAASASPKSFDDATALGATATIDRNGDVATDTIAAVGKVDAVIDLVGPAAWPTAIGALKDGGRFVSTIPGGSPPSRRMRPGTRSESNQTPPASPSSPSWLPTATSPPFVGKRMGLGATADALSRAVTAGRHRVVILP